MSRIIKYRQNSKSKKNYKIRPLNNYEIQDLIVKLKIPFFIGVYLRDTLLKKRTKPKKQECWILNHGTSKTDGTHWTALAKNGNKAYYFDSFGKLGPPKEVVTYLRNSKTQLFYNVDKYQRYDMVNCGHFAIKFLYDFWKNI